MATSNSARWPRHPLLDPKGIADDGPAQDGRATAAAAVDTSIGRVKVWFEMRGGTWVLRTSLLEKPNPYGYGGRPIRLFPEVISADKNLVLFNLRSPHPAIPTESFVYSFSTGSAGTGTPSVVRLPRAAPDITVPRATGILRAMDGGSYVVASLWQKSNPEIGGLDTFLHRWWYSSSSSQWTQRRQRVTLPSHRSTWEWRTDCVVPFEDSLLWVDLTHGILLFNNLDHGSDPKVHFVDLPFDLPRTYPRGVARPELFRSVGCCDGKLTLVNLLYNGDTLDVTIWTRQKLYARNGNFIWEWKKDTKISGPFNCRFLWDDMSAKLQYTNKDLPPPWKNRLPCFPVLSKDKRQMLYLTVAGKKDEHAWLLQIDMQAKAEAALKDVVDYPSFCRHKKPPCPSDLSKYSPP